MLCQRWCKENVAPSWSASNHHPPIFGVLLWALVGQDKQQGACCRGETGNSTVMCSAAGWCLSCCCRCRHCSYKINWVAVLTAIVFIFRYMALSSSIEVSEQGHHGNRHDWHTAVELVRKKHLRFPFVVAFWKISTRGLTSCVCSHR